MTFGKVHRTKKKEVRYSDADIVAYGRLRSQGKTKGEAEAILNSCQKIKSVSTKKKRRTKDEFPQYYGSGMLS